MSTGGGYSRPSAEADDKVDFSVLPKYEKYRGLSISSMDTLFGHITYQQLLDNALKTGHEESMEAALCKLRFGLHEFKMDLRCHYNRHFRIRVDNERLRIDLCTDMYNILSSEMSTNRTILTNLRTAKTILEIVNCEKAFIRFPEPDKYPIIPSIRWARIRLAGLNFKDEEHREWLLQLIFSL